MLTSLQARDAAAIAAEHATLLVSFELSQRRWELTVRQPGNAKLSRFGLPARDTTNVLNLLQTQPWMA